MAESDSKLTHVVPRQQGLAPGSLVGGHYEVIRAIGHGGKSRVYEARHVWTQREVALKALDPPKHQDDKSHARFVTEARTAARLTHPNIVRVLDMGEDDAGQPFIVQELIHGERLSSCIKRLRCLSVDTAIKVFVPLLDALTMAHDHGVVHRDVTPNNILLAEQTTGGIVPKLADFGVAREMTRDVSSRITEQGALLGTPLYMSPEQIRAEPDIDPRSDVWSAGACLYLAITGKVPFHGGSLVELAAQILMAELRKPSDWQEGIPPDLDEVLQYALAKEREGRYATARGFRDALRKLGHAARRRQESIDPGDADISRLIDSAPRRPLTVSVEALPSPANIDLGSLRAASRARPLRVGMVVRNAAAHAQVEAAFAETLGIRCDVWCYFDYAELVDALSDRDVEFAWLPPVAYVRARRSKTAHLLLTVERAGKPTYASAILARSGGRERIEDIDRARAVWVDPWSAAGYIMPLALLRARGLEPAEIFSSQAFVGSHEAVLDALVAGGADIGATHCTVDPDGSVARRPWDDADGLRLLAVSGPIPGDTFCSAPRVSKNLRRLVCRALMDDRRVAPVLAALGASRIATGDPDAYRALERALIGRAP